MGFEELPGRLTYPCTEKLGAPQVHGDRGAYARVAHVAVNLYFFIMPFNKLLNISVCLSSVSRSS